MIPFHIKALAAVRYRAHENRFPGSVVISRIALGRLLTRVPLERDQVEYGRRKVSDLSTFLTRHVAGHRQGLEVDFRSHHGRAEVQQDAAFQPRDRLDEGQEIAIARRPKRGAVAIPMLVNDVVADADVNRYRHAQPDARGQYADVRVRKGAVEEPPPQPL